MCVIINPLFVYVCQFCREEIEKQRAAEAYRKLHEAGKTDEARSDLARLAIIRQQREETSKQRETERKGNLLSSLCRTSLTTTPSHAPCTHTAAEAAAAKEKR